MDIDDDNGDGERQEDQGEPEVPNDSERRGVRRAAEEAAEAVRPPPSQFGQIRPDREGLEGLPLAPSMLRNGLGPQELDWMGGVDLSSGTQGQVPEYGERPSFEALR